MPLVSSKTFVVLGNLRSPLPLGLSKISDALGNHRSAYRLARPRTLLRQTIAILLRKKLAILLR